MIISVRARRWRARRILRPVSRFPTSELAIKPPGDAGSRPSEGCCFLFGPPSIAPLLISIQTNPVEYRGIRYTIRVRIEREQWYVAIHPDDVEVAGRLIVGPRENAESHAHSLINKWLEKHSRKNTKVPSKINDHQHT